MGLGNGTGPSKEKTGLKSPEAGKRVDEGA